MKVEYEKLYRTNPTRLAYDYEEALKWLSTKLNINPQSRLNYYLPLLKELAKLKHRKELADIIDENEELRTSFFEAHEITEVCNYLKIVEREVEIPKETLHRLKGGIMLYSDVSTQDKDQSRDTFFELFVAARLIQNKIKITLSELTDVIAHYKKYKILIECKRPKSQQQLLEAITVGFNQVEKRLTSDSADEVGFVFVSISKIINPQLKLFKFKTIQDGNIFSRDLCLYYDTFCDLSLSDYIRRNKKTYPQEKILGFAFHLSLPFLTESHLLTFRTFHYMRGIHQNTSPYYNFFIDLESKFKRIFDNEAITDNPIKSWLINNFSKK